jgi:hypothetical protein
VVGDLVVGERVVDELVGGKVVGESVVGSKFVGENAGGIVDKEMLYGLVKLFRAANVVAAFFGVNISILPFEGEML